MRLLALSPALLAQLPGDQGEHEAIAEPWVRCLADKITRDGWSEDSVVSVFVYEDGTVTLGDGNHRVRAAVLVGRATVPTAIRECRGSWRGR